MQLKKKDVQMAIQETALELFYQKGYFKTKMSDIGKQMNMSVGNIYTYFKNKDELFDTVITTDTVDYIEETIVNLARTCNEYHLEKDTASINDAIEKYLRVIVNNYREVVIILDKSEGMVYEKKRCSIIEKIIEVRRSTGLTPSYIGSSFEVRKKFDKIIINGIFDVILMGLKEDAATSEERYELCLALFKFQIGKNYDSYPKE